MQVLSYMALPISNNRINMDICDDDDLEALRLAALKTLKRVNENYCTPKENKAPNSSNTYSHIDMLRKSPTSQHFCQHQTKPNLIAIIPIENSEAGDHHSTPSSVHINNNNVNFSPCTIHQIKSEVNHKTSNIKALSKFSRYERCSDSDDSEEFENWNIKSSQLLTISNCDNLQFPKNEMEDEKLEVIETAENPVKTCSVFSQAMVQESNKDLRTPKKFSTKSSISDVNKLENNMKCNASSQKIKISDLKNFPLDYENGQKVKNFDLSSENDFLTTSYIKNEIVKCENENVDYLDELKSMEPLLIEFIESETDNYESDCDKKKSELSVHENKKEIVEFVQVTEINPQDKLNSQQLINVMDLRDELNKRRQKQNASLDNIRVDRQAIKFFTNEDDCFTNLKESVVSNKRKVHIFKWNHKKRKELAPSINITIPHDYQTNSRLPVHMRLGIPTSTNAKRKITVKKSVLTYNPTR